MVWIGLGILWIVCGILGYGTSLAYFRGIYPSLIDTRTARSHSLLIGVLGIGGLVGGLIFGWMTTGRPFVIFKYGLKFW